VIAVPHSSNENASGRRRRRAAALAACHLLLFVALPVAHAALPVHDGSAAAHACPLCQTLQRGVDALPAIVIGVPGSAPPAAPLVCRPIACVLGDDGHDLAAPRAPPLA
jgi:hypothetical protein